MTSMRRSRIADRSPRAGARGSAAIAVVFVIFANLMLFGVLAAVLLPRSDGDTNAETARAPAVAMASPTTPPSEPIAAAAPVAADAQPAPSAALTPPTVTSGRPSLVLARSAQRVRRACPLREPRRVSVAQHPIPSPELARPASP